MPRLNLAELARIEARDRRIEELQDRWSTLTRAEQHELQSLEAARDHMWRRLPARIAAARRKLDSLMTYARRAGFADLDR